MSHSMMGQRILARIPDLARPRSGPKVAAVAASQFEPAAKPATSVVRAAGLRPKLTWDPSQLRIPRLSSRGKLILGACAMLAAIWLIRGRADGTGSPPSVPSTEATSRLTVVPLEPPSQLPQPLVNQPSVGPATVVAPQTAPTVVETIRRAELPRNELPRISPPPAMSMSGERYSVAPPSTQPVPAWQERSAQGAAHGAARRELVPPANVSSSNGSPIQITPGAERGGAIPPPMPALWPQNLRAPQSAQGPNIQRNQFVDQHPAAAVPVNSVDSQIEWAAPFAPGRGPVDSVRTSDRRSDPAGARFEGTIQVSPHSREYDGRSGSIVH